MDNIIQSHIADLSFKQNLTITEASEYSNIGINKIRSMVGEFGCPFALHIGKRVLIKRKEFDEYMSKATNI